MTTLNFAESGAQTAFTEYWLVSGRFESVVAALQAQRGIDQFSASGLGSRWREIPVMAEPAAERRSKEYINSKVGEGKACCHPG